MSVVMDHVAVVRGGVRVLHHVSLSVDTGERLTITGANGAGKTTLLKAVLGLLPCSEGSIRVGGTVVGSSQWRTDRRRIGYVNQLAVNSDLPISASEVVAIGLCEERLSGRQKRARVAESMEAAGCLHLRGARYARLSGGEKQRVSIARCLCARPQLLLLDEPTASLDPEGKQSLLDLVEQLSRAQQLTVLLVSHESVHFDRVGWRRLVIESGRLLNGTAEGIRG